MLSAQTSCAQIESSAFPVDVHGDWLDVREPAPSGVLHRVAHSIAEMACLPTEIALRSQVFDSFLDWYRQPSYVNSFVFSLDDNVKMIPQFRS